jgi:hypothetical protein
VIDRGGLGADYGRHGGLSTDLHLHSGGASDPAETRTGHALALRVISTIIIVGASLSIWCLNPPGGSFSRMATAREM